ncbi:2'-5' RNA ligase family protein [Catenuloplanes japonicus]|uniref:2'-5' RNA ligase family protein n=1 Tax=Catenuloplanes japonicus TaxID=33876 RepID=UPI0005240CD5|nr:2'-5' RNA ligase family protein [Catenuloplanes japonicus]
MEKFMSGSRIWPDEQTRLHFYLLPSLDLNAELDALITDYRDVVEEFPFVTLVQDEWLHVTLHMVTGVAAEEVGDRQRRGLVRTVGTYLEGLGPMTLTAGPALATRNAVVLDVDGDLPGDPFHEVYTRIRAAVEDTIGVEAVEFDAMPPHITLAYANSSGDSGRVQSLLRRKVRPSRATFTVDEIHLVEVEQDALRTEYRWDPIATFPLLG